MPGGGAAATAQCSQRQISIVTVAIPWFLLTAAQTKSPLGEIAAEATVVKITQC